MNGLTFREAVCRQYAISPEDFPGFVLKRTLFRRVWLFHPLVKVFYPDYLFNELRLIEKAGVACGLEEIQEEINFYQHKYVVDFVLKDAFRFRLSGMRLMRLAHRAFSASEKLETLKSANSRNR